MKLSLNYSDLDLYNRLMSGNKQDLSSYIKDELYMSRLSKTKRYNIQKKRSQDITKALMKPQSAWKMVQKIVNTLNSVPLEKHKEYKTWLAKQMRSNNLYAVRELGDGVVISSRGSNTFALLNFYLHGYRVMNYNKSEVGLRGIKQNIMPKQEPRWKREKRHLEEKRKQQLKQEKLTSFNLQKHLDQKNDQLNKKDN